METPEHADKWKRIAGNSQVLLRSRIEIAAILQSLVDGKLPLVSCHQIHDQMFITQLHRVCAEQNFIVVGYSDNRIVNSGVFAARSVLLGASHSRGYVKFMARNPVEQDDPVQAIRFDFPESLLIEQRRLRRRVRVGSGTNLDCLADSGGITPFEARIVDVSLSGLGVMVYDPAIRLSPGTVLTGCRIDLPDGSVAFLDMEVMHSTTIVLPDGSSVCRAGCRFISDQDKLDELLKVFVLDLERHDG